MVPSSKDTTKRRNNLCVSPYVVFFFLHREQRKGWHIVRCLALIPFVTPQIHR